MKLPPPLPCESNAFPEQHEGLLAQLLERANLSHWRGSFPRAVYAQGEAWGGGTQVLLLLLPLR